MHTLDTRTLNRTHLHRQHLLTRADLPVTDMIAHLVGVQAQVNNSPYIGLWSRIAGLTRDALTDALRDRTVVRAPAWRSTLHLLTRADYLAFRRALEPALIRGLNSFFGARARALDTTAVVEYAREVYAEAPRTQGEIRAILLEAFPKHDPEALAYCARSYLPLVQVFPGGVWGTGGSPAYADAESWLGAPISDDYSIIPVFRRYLAAFGPASIADFQFWAGIPRLKGAIEAVRDQFTLYRDARGVELYDLPGAPIIDGAAPVPPRLIAEYDNLIIAHDDRSRIIAEADYRKIFLSAARVLPTLLVDGFVAGAWRIEREKKRLTVTIAPFAPLDADVTEALEAEARALLAFAADAKDDPAAFSIRWLEPG
jgi:hypothetical protein